MNGEVKDIAFSMDGQRMYSHGGESSLKNTGKPVVFSTGILKIVGIFYTTSMKR